jgi:tubulin-folding cofactor B
LIGYLADETTNLGDYDVYDFCRLHVVDLNPGKLAELSDLSKVEKYVMADEDYDRLRNSVRAQKKAMGLYKDPSEQAAKPGPDEADIAHVVTGERCEVTSDDGLARRGVVRFVGQTEFGTGWWVGVALDEPMGKNDGSVKGKRYFECPNKYGTFVRPDKVKCGPQYTERGLDDDEDDL